MTFKPFDVIVVPFPYADIDIVRKRPAVVLSAHDGFGEQTGVIVTAMISAPLRSIWPFDTALVDVEDAGLYKPSVVRMKIMTIDYRRVERTLGRLTQRDSNAVIGGLRQLFPYPLKK